MLVVRQTTFLTTCMWKLVRKLVSLQFPPRIPQVYMEYIRGLPINDTPEMFGLHDNANITFAVNETYQLLNGIVKLQPKSKSGGGRSQEEVSSLVYPL